MNFHPAQQRELLCSIFQPHCKLFYTSIRILTLTASLCSGLNCEILRPASVGAPGALWEAGAPNGSSALHCCRTLPAAHRCERACCALLQHEQAWMGPNVQASSSPGWPHSQNAPPCRHLHTSPTPLSLPNSSVSHEDLIDHTMAVGGSAATVDLSKIVSEAFVKAGEVILESRIHGNRPKAPEQPHKGRAWVSVGPAAWLQV